MAVPSSSASAPPREVFILSGVRTAIGKYGGV
jgi:hypothetical protein